MIPFLSAIRLISSFVFFFFTALGAGCWMIPFLATVFWVSDRLQPSYLSSACSIAILSSPLAVASSSPDPVQTPFIGVDPLYFDVAVSMLMRTVFSFIRVTSGSV